MDYKDFIRKGNQVIYHFKEWRKVYYNERGYDWVPTWKRVRIISSPRDWEGKFTKDFYYDDVVTVKVKDEDGKIFTTEIEKLEADVDPSTLCEDDLQKLWKEIRRGSMYYSDYRNSLGVFENTAMDVYEAHYEDLRNRFGDDEKADEHNTPEEFAEYVKYATCCIPKVA